MELMYSHQKAPNESSALFCEYLYLTPLFLALGKRDKSKPCARTLVRLWREERSLSLIRWGDTAWGGSLTLLDLLVDKNIGHGFKRCKQAGIMPTVRTWNIALLQDDESPLYHLVSTYGDPGNLPVGHPNAEKALAYLHSRHLKRHTLQCSEGENSKRL